MANSPGLVGGGRMNGSFERIMVQLPSGMELPSTPSNRRKAARLWKKHRAECLQASNLVNTETAGLEKDVADATRELDHIDPEIVRTVAAAVELIERVKTAQVRSLAIPCVRTFV